MKELSIEEKAKRYDEAIERAESIYDEIAIPSATTKGICTYIFPELVESKDERIRKALIEHFRWNVQQILNDFDNKKVLAWLEKQGEHTKFTEKQDNTKFRKYIEIASNVLVKLLESDKFQKDVKEHLFDKGDKEFSGIYDIYAEEAVKYVKALYKHLNK